MKIGGGESSLNSFSSLNLFSSTGKGDQSFLTELKNLLSFLRYGPTSLNFTSLKIWLWEDKVSPKKLLSGFSIFALFPFISPNLVRLPNYGPIGIKIVNPLP